MAIAALLKVPIGKRAQNGFTFDHAMEHRRLNAAVNSVNPSYVIDPAPPRLQSRARKWNQDHQSLHDNFVKSIQQTVPNYPASHNMIDSNLQQQQSLRWWTFVNHMEHHTANRTISALALS